MATSPGIMQLVISIIVGFGLLATTDTVPDGEHRYRNVAQFKPAVQSSSYGPNNPASLAVDDSPTSCSRTSETKGARWTVDLGQPYIISHLRISTGSAFFGQNFEIYIGQNDGQGHGTLCGYGPTSDIRLEYTISCFGGAMSGQILTIKNRFTGGIKLCNVQILECDDGYFGATCEKRCQCKDGAMCAKDTGTCPGLCAPGWNGTDCQIECAEGRFGAGCRQHCHCMDDEPCDIVEGQCDVSCADAWVGPSCQTAIPRLMYAPTLQAPRTTASEMTIMWPSWSGHIDPPISLRYQVEYKLSDYHGGNESGIWRPGPVVDDTADTTQTATVLGLRRNSFYEFRVGPILRVGDRDVPGIVSPHSGTFRTKCHVPEKPNITNVVVAWQYMEEQDYVQPVISVEWTLLSPLQSNCDNIQYYEIEYQKYGTSERLRAMAPQSSSIKNLTEGIEFDSEYWIVVVAHNNEPLDRSSNGVRVATLPPSALAVGYRRSSAGPDYRIIIGSVVICSCVLLVIILVLVLYRRSLAKYNSVPSKDPEGKASAALNNAAKPGNRNGNQFDSGIGDVATLPMDASMMQSSRFLENGHLAKLAADRPPPPERFPIKVAELEDYIMARRANDSEQLRNEYRDLADATKESSSCAGERSENRLKNRFINILPYDHSRVILDKIEEDVDSDYINASFIDGYKRPKAYIAAQGCNKWTIQDMWRMVWQINSGRIVMVTNLVEKGKLKCEQYWPDTENEEKMYGDLGVTLTSVERTVDFVVRSFELRKATDIRQVKQFHYTSWPDHGVPIRASPIIAFRRRVRAHDESHPGVMVVHCSAGVGRTGAFIALDYLLEQAVAEGYVDIYNLTNRMRKDRVNMIQTVEQYIFVYDALLEALKVGKTVISCSDFKPEFDKLTAVDPATGRSKLDDQYQLLENMSPKSKPEDYSLGSVPENKEKNRFPEILPADRHRPYLMTRVQGTNDYINAVFLDGYRSSNAYIITQMPLPHTVIDLWRMIYEHKCGSIVMLNPWDEADESIGQYWPEENEECECGPFIIEAMSIDRQAPDITVRELKLTYHPQSPMLKKKEDAPLTVNQFQYHAWRKDAGLPTACGSLMTLLEMIERSQFKTGNHAVVIHCMDGVTQSGLFVAISCIWERLKDEQEVDIFQAVKQLRFHRPQIIKDQEQYRFCHELVQTYLDEFATYANFK